MNFQLSPHLLAINFNFLQRKFAIYLLFLVEFLNVIFILIPHLKAMESTVLQDMMAMQYRGERLLQIHILIEQEVQLPSSDWPRATELYILSNQTISL